MDLWMSRSWVLVSAALAIAPTACSPYRALPLTPGLIPRELVVAPGAEPPRVRYVVRGEEAWREMTVRAVTPPLLGGEAPPDSGGARQRLELDLRTVESLELHDGASRTWRAIGVVLSGVVGTVTLVGIVGVVAWQGALRDSR